MGNNTCTCLDHNQDKNDVKIDERDKIISTITTTKYEQYKISVEVIQAVMKSFLAK